MISSNSGIMLTALILLCPGSSACVPGFLFGGRLSSRPLSFLPLFLLLAPSEHGARVA
jgi:hypothetical protein